MSGKTVVVDLDGTLLTKRWPELGEWQPGAIGAMLRLHEAGINIKLHSVRLNAYDPFTLAEKEPYLVATEVQKVRAKLDSAGLTFIDIWPSHLGKPYGDSYIDDNGDRYQGHKKSWDKLTEKILLRLGMETD